MPHGKIDWRLSAAVLSQATTQRAEKSKSHGGEKGVGILGDQILQFLLRSTQVTLAPQSSPHRTEVVAALCELLNETETCFPGTSLILRFAIHRAPSVSSETGG